MLKIGKNNIYQFFQQILFLALNLSNRVYNFCTFLVFLQFIQNLNLSMLKIYLLLAASIFILGNAYLQVYIPQCARKIIGQNINYTLSNFGYIPYGESMVGQVFLPKAENNEDLCKVENQQPVKSQGGKTIILARRGNCKFTQKVLNGQKLGADMVIVYDNEQSSKPHIIMKNDGHGHLVTIPSVFVSNSDGLNIIKSIQQCNEAIMLKQVFDVFQTDIVDLSLWLNLNNRQSYILLKDFYKYDYFNVIEQYVNTSVKFRVDYGCSVTYCEEADCLGSKENRYCLAVERGMGVRDVTPGGEILKESLRMYALFYLLPENKDSVWFEYMERFDAQICLEEKDVEACSYEAMKQSGVSSDLIQTIKNNVTQTLKILQSNTFNQQNVFYWITNEADQKNIIFYPQAVINGKNFYGLFKAPQVFEMICNSLLAQPKECYSFIKNKTSPQALQKTDDLWLTVFFIVLLMTLGFLVALFVYTRLIKKQVNQQMSMQVNKMVEQYVSLSQQKSANLSKSQM